MHLFLFSLPLYFSPFSFLFIVRSVSSEFYFGALVLLSILVLDNWSNALHCRNAWQHDIKPVWLSFFHLNTNVCLFVFNFKLWTHFFFKISSFLNRMKKVIQIWEDISIYLLNHKKKNPRIKNINISELPLCSHITNMKHKHTDV